MAKRITFDRTLYLPEAVEAAAAAYAGHAEIAVTPSDDAMVAEISGCGENDPDMIANAFCNYVLQETIARLRQAELREVR